MMKKLFLILAILGLTIQCNQNEPENDFQVKQELRLPTCGGEKLPPLIEDFYWEGGTPNDNAQFNGNEWITYKVGYYDSEGTGACLEDGWKVEMRIGIFDGYQCPNHTTQDPTSIYINNVQHIFSNLGIVINQRPITWQFLEGYENLDYTIQMPWINRSSCKCYRISMFIVNPEGTRIIAGGLSFRDFSVKSSFLSPSCYVNY